MHERPGVYSTYDASAVVSAGQAAKVIGVAAKAVKGTAGEAVTVTGYAAGVAAFGEDAADTPGMSTILRLLFANGASTVVAVRVAEAGAAGRTTRTAFAALGGAGCPDSGVRQRRGDGAAGAADCGGGGLCQPRMERIAVVGGDGESGSGAGGPTRRR